MEFVAIDFETTGLSPGRGARVIEIGAVRVSKGEIADEFSSFVSQEEDQMPPHITRITGITSEMLLGAPSPTSAFGQLSDFIRDSDLVAHNARFDKSFLDSELGRVGLSSRNHFHCSLVRSRKVLPNLRKFNLASVAKELLPTLPDNTIAHRALSDARIAAWIWIELCRRGEKGAGSYARS